MKKLTAILCAITGFIGIARAGETNEFKMAIEGESCVIHAYQDPQPRPLTVWFEAKPGPQPQWLIAILCNKSNVTAFLSNDELRALYASPLSDEKLEKMRAGSAKRAEMTRASAPDNPWKGMTQSLDSLFVIESSKGKFLLYVTNAKMVGDNTSNGRMWGALKWVEGKWKLGKTELDIKNLATVSDEFLKLKADGKIKAEPLDSLN